MDYVAIDELLKTQNLTILGGFYPTANDGTPPNCKTLILLGPREPNFWKAFKNSPEYQKDQTNPLDKWSRRVIINIASSLNAIPLFPFGKAPYLPFYKWAIKTHRSHESPIKLLVHDKAGLFVSFRGALSFDKKIKLPKPPPNPCKKCSAPCLNACPVSAFASNNYHSELCKTHILGKDSKNCVTSGCAARRICPISKSFPRLSEQSAFHMSAFLKP
jgi:ferredoxin